MNKSLRQASSKSEAKFVLIHGQTKQEEPIRWHWLTQRPRAPQEDAPDPAPRLSYSEKKSLLSELPRKERAVSSFKIRDGFSRKERVRAVSTAASGSKTDRRSLQPFLYLNANEHQLSVPNINLRALRETLVGRMVEAQMGSRAVIAVLSARRTGLRYKLVHSFAEWCPCGRSSHGHELGALGEQVRRQVKEFSRIDRELYFFFPDGSPVHSHADIERRRPDVLLVDCSPKLNFAKELLSKIGEQAQQIQQIFDHSSRIKKKEEVGREEGVGGAGGEE